MYACTKAHACMPVHVRAHKCQDTFVSVRERGTYINYMVNYFLMSYIYFCPHSRETMGKYHEEDVSSLEIYFADLHLRK